MPSEGGESVVPSKESPEPMTSVDTCPVPFPRRIPVRVVLPVPPFATGKVPVTPVPRGSPVALVRTMVEGVPRLGVTKVGEVANTSAPLPVSSVTIPASSEEVSISVPAMMLMPPWRVSSSARVSISVERMMFAPPICVSSSPIVSSSFERRTALSRKLPEIEVVAITEPDALVERRDEVRPVMAKVEVVALVKGCRG